MVAFIDDYRTSSTWKFLELFYASGASPKKDKEYIKKPIKCFVKDVSKNVNVKFLIEKNLVLPFDGSLNEIKRKMLYSKNY
ncbi:MAG: hypothetical protein HQM08_01565 [Candidatus Riflebacteria bacterium]|nr:hypothetical protein [Candidatus Riflebacteria bacterium]